MISQRLIDDQKNAMKAGDKDRLRTIRSLRAALTEREIELRKGGSSTLSAEEEVRILQKQAKQRADSIDQFRAAGRDDLADREQTELEIIQSYLPTQMSDDELRDIVSTVIAETGASTPADLGKVMGPAIARIGPGADGRRVNAVVRELLSAG